MIKCLMSVSSKNRDDENEWRKEGRKEERINVRRMNETWNE